MCAWHLKSGDPLALTLAADARLTATNYGDDQIWQLNLRGGEPPALAFETTYGLRARSFRIFPSFQEGDEARIDPADFASAPVVQNVFPNFLALSCSPFQDIDVKVEYWVPESQAVAGRVTLINRTRQARTLRMEWIGQLSPTEGERMTPTEMQAAPVLAGRTANLAPVLFMTGGPRPHTGSYPSLVLERELAPGEPAISTWVCAARTDSEASFEQARSLAARNWDAERARLEMLNAGRLEILTGQPDWDAAFFMSQNQALNLFVGPTTALPHPSFVIAREPDQGHSLREDGSDYSHLWNGQQPLTALFLVDQILPANPELAKGLVHNFLTTQQEDGFIDWKPGLAGQRSRLLATPLLAALSWRVYQACEDRDFLQSVFPKLVRFAEIWFSSRHDRDEDGVPEWDSLLQTCFDDHPIYSSWHTGAQGVEISTAESPALSAMLYRECQALIQMSEAIGQPEKIPDLKALGEPLRTAVQAAWDVERAGYFDWDRDTHLSAQEELLGEQHGPGDMNLRREFDNPVRLRVEIETGGESARQPELCIHGTSASGFHRVETIPPEDFRWFMERGSITGERVYTALEKIEIRGLEPDSLVRVLTVGYSSRVHTNLLPLWAGIPDEEQARSLVVETITSPQRFWRDYGLPALGELLDQPQPQPWRSVQMTWNELVGEGLLRYGYRQEAVELVMRLMQAVTAGLKKEGAFRGGYDAGTGQGTGERNALTGLAPIGLFLRTLGVQVISPYKVVLSGFNPFPWPVTIKYRGLNVMCQKDKYRVIFPDGQTVTIDDPAPRIVALLPQPAGG